MPENNLPQFFDCETCQSSNAPPACREAVLTFIRVDSGQARQTAEHIRAGQMSTEIGLDIRHEAHHVLINDFAEKIRKIGCQLSLQVIVSKLEATAWQAYSDIEAYPDETS